VKKTFDLIEFITESNAIEQIYLPKEKFRENIDKKVPEIVGQLEAIKCANRFRYPIKPSNIKDIHYLLCRNILKPQYRGWYREINVRVGRYKKVKPYLIPDLIAKFCGMFNRKEDPLKCHYFFECTHPFLDFNGRTGRVLLLTQQRLQGIKRSIIKHSKKYEYYKKIRKYEIKEFKKIAFRGV